MTPQTAFKMYFGLNLHFNQKSYSILKYGLHTKPAHNKYDALTKEQKYRFEWLSNKYPVTQDLIYACIGSQFADINLQFDTKDVVIEAYAALKSRREGITYSLKQNRSKHELLDNIPMDKLLFRYFVGEFSPEYVILLDEKENCLETLYGSAEFLWAKPKILKLIKYKSFFNAKKYLQLL